MHFPILSIETERGPTENKNFAHVVYVVNTTTCNLLEVIP